MPNGPAGVPVFGNLLDWFKARSDSTITTWVSIISKLNSIGELSVNIVI